MTRKKIMLFVPSFGGGGAERAIVNLARGFKDLGHDVEIAVCKSGGEYLSEVPGGINVINLKASRVLWGSVKLLYQVVIRKPDLLISTLTHANIAICLISSLFPRKTKLVVRESSTPSQTRAETGSIKAKLYFSLLSVAYKFCNKVAAVSYGVKKDLVVNFKIPEDKIFVVKNPVITPEIEELGNLEIDPSVTHDRPFILAVGRLTKAKNFSMLVDAFYMIRDRIPHKLIVLGEGEDRHSLENKVALLELGDRISFPGFMKNPFAFMSKCDLFVLSSNREGFPNVLVQAAFCGAKIVSTDCKSGPSDFLCGAARKYLVPVDDAKSMSDKMVDVISSESVVNFEFDEYHYKSSALYFYNALFDD